jgi:hypothetical protein
MNKLIGINDVDIENSFLLKRISILFPDHVIIGDYISKKDIFSFLKNIRSKKIFYNNESFHNNYKYYRPNFIYDNVISFSGKRSFYYPIIADFIKSFRYELEPSDNHKDVATCLIASNLKKINKYSLVIQSYPDYKIYGKFHRQTLPYESKNLYESFHRSAILTTTRHLSSLAIENSFQKGYFTEKIIIPLISRTVPLYIGNRCIRNFINPKYFIFESDLNSLTYSQKLSLIYKVSDKLKSLNSLENCFSTIFKDYLCFLDSAFVNEDIFNNAITQSQQFKSKLLA